jgi:MFS family permease
VFYGWWIVLAAFALHAVSGSLFFHAYGAYFVYLQGEFGWSRTLLSGAFSLSRLESGPIGPLQGWLIQRLGSRTVVRIGLVLFSLGFLLMSRMDSVASFYAAFLVIAIGSGLSGFLTINLVLVNWFERRRSTAIALAATGTSVAGLLVPAVAWALSTFGWRATALGSAVLLLAVGLPVSQIIRQAPEAYGSMPDGRPLPSPLGGRGEGEGGGRSRSGMAGHGGPAPRPAASFRAREALRTRAFWMLAGGHSLALVSVSALAAHLIPFLVAELDMTVESGAGMVAVLTFVSLLAHVAGGFVGDRVNKRVLATVCMGVHAAALLVLASATAPLAVIGAATLQGLAWGFRGPIMTPLRADYFGRAALPTLEGFAALVTTAGLTLGPIAAGFIADRSGSYRLAFLFVAAMMIFGGLCFGLAARPNSPMAPGAPHEP